MNNFKWEVENVEMFLDDNETQFIRGPFEFEEHGSKRSYDYKLIDKDGEDYCTINQMKDWGVQMHRKMK